MLVRSYRTVSPLLPRR